MQRTVHPFQTEAASLGPHERLVLAQRSLRRWPTRAFGFGPQEPLVVPPQKPLGFGHAAVRQHYHRGRAVAAVEGSPTAFHGGGGRCMFGIYMTASASSVYVTACVQDLPLLPRRISHGRPGHFSDARYFSSVLAV